jgi:ribonuclease P protein component
MNRLTDSRDFTAAFRHGRARFSDHLIVRLRNRQDSAPPRVGLVVTNRIGRAVVRSRIKRVLREAAARNERLLPDGHDVLLIARPATVDLDRAGGMNAVADVMARLLAPRRRRERARRS